MTPDLAGLGGYQELHHQVGAGGIHWVGAGDIHLVRAGGIQ